MRARTIEYCRETDIPELFDCFKEWYRFNPRLQERDYFDWQFRDTPTRLADSEYDFLVLRNEAGAIVGCLGFTGFEFRLGTEIRRGGWTHNWYAKGQADGGLALLGRFMELVDNRFLIRFNEQSGAIFRLLRIPSSPALPRWWAAIDNLQAQALFQISSPADRAVLARSSAIFHRRAVGPQVLQVDRLDPDEEFGFGHLGGTSGHARRTGRYLNWRYGQIPKHNYRLIRSSRAFAVYRIEQIMGQQASVVRLLEWTFATDETGAALATVRADAAEYDPILIDFHGTLHAVGSVLESFGFVRQEATERKMPDLFRPTFHSGGYAIAIDMPPHRTARMIDFPSWYITAGDSDVDRVKL